MNYRINITRMVLILLSRKDFFLFNLNDSKTKVTSYKLTNDLKRYRKDYENFRLLDIVKKQNINKIKL